MESNTDNTVVPGQSESTEPTHHDGTPVAGGSSGQSQNKALKSVTGSGKSKKPHFNRSFKQAVFLKRGNEDGSSQLHVSFTSAASRISSVKPPVVPAQKPKSRPVTSLYRDIVTIDKRKIQEEIDSLPKPEHLIEAEKLLLSFEGMKKFDKRSGELESHRCAGCTDIFPTQYTLQDHLERLSYTLTLNCLDCKKRLTYPNKCAMYVHLVSHYGIDLPQCQRVASECSHIAILPRNTSKTSAITDAKPEAMTNGHHAPVDESIKGGIVTRMEDGTHSNDNRTNGEEPQPSTTSDDTAKENEDLSTMMINADPQESSHTENGTSAEEDAVDDKRFVCSECSARFETEWTLRTHFSVPRNDAQKPEVCVPCRVEMPTPCSLKAHMRVHSLAEPYTCPDCGVVVPKKNIFLKHLRLQCLHYSKLSEYLCPVCPESFPDADSQAKHLLAQPQHLRFDGERSYYKCNGCPKAFKSVAAHSKHETCPGAGCTVVHMCNNCPQQTVFRSWSELTDHRAQSHPNMKWVAKRSRIFVCYLCAHKTRSKQGFTDHLLKTHGKKMVEFMCHDCGVEMESRQSLDDHQDFCPFKINHQNKQPVVAGAIRLPKLSSGSSAASDVGNTNNVGHAENVTDLRGVEGDANPPDPVPVTYMNHSPSFNCHICTAECSNYKQLRDHVTRKHGGRGMIYECWICRDRGNTASFYRQSALDKHMVDVHKMQPTPAAHEEVATNGCEEAECEVAAKRLRLWTQADDLYQCCRCEFSCASGDEFKDHIKEHRSLVDTFQCVECGMCFPVQLALRRHLFAVHKVSDYVKYSRHQYMAEYEKQLHGAQGKCPVCEKQFEEEMLLRKHLRTHGMMYINTRRMVTS